MKNQWRVWGAFFALSITYVPGFAASDSHALYQRVYLNVGGGGALWFANGNMPVGPSLDISAHIRIFGPLAIGASWDASRHSGSAGYEFSYTENGQFVSVKAKATHVFSYQGFDVAVYPNIGKRLIARGALGIGALVWKREISDTSTFRGDDTRLTAKGEVGLTARISKRLGIGIGSLFVCGRQRVTHAENYTRTTPSPARLCFTLGVQLRI